MRLETKSAKKNQNKGARMFDFKLDGQKIADFAK
jgi:hypothetical protein